MVVGGSRCGIRVTPWGLFSDPKPRDLYHKFLLLKGVPNTKNSCKVRGVNRTDSRNIRKVGLFCKFEQFRFFYLGVHSKRQAPQRSWKIAWACFFRPLILMRIDDKKFLNVDLTAVAGENCSPPTVPMTMKKRSRDLHILEVRNKGGTTWPRILPCYLKRCKNLWNISMLTEGEMGGVTAPWPFTDVWNIHKKRESSKSQIQNLERNTTQEKKWG